MPSPAPSATTSSTSRPRCSAPAPDVNTVDGNGLSDFGYSFRQFMDHDMDLTPDQTGFPVPSLNPDKDGLKDLFQIVQLHLGGCTVRTLPRPAIMSQNALLALLATLVALVALPALLATPETGSRSRPPRRRTSPPPAGSTTRSPGTLALHTIACATSGTSADARRGSGSPAAVDGRTVPSLLTPPNAAHSA
jgi:hypothetical protein